MECSRFKLRCICCFIFNQVSCGVGGVLLLMFFMCVMTTCSMFSLFLSGATFVVNVASVQLHLEAE